LKEVGNPEVFRIKAFIPWLLKTSSIVSAQVNEKATIHDEIED
jgi:hypothetical protein